MNIVDDNDDDDNDAGRRSKGILLTHLVSLKIIKYDIFRCLRQHQVALIRFRCIHIKLDILSSFFETVFVDNIPCIYHIKINAFY